MASFARSGKKDGEKNNADRFGLKPGAEYHGYVLIERLGAGGFGEAWLAENLDGEKLALKFPANLDFETLDVLRREVSLYKRLREAMRGDNQRPPIVALKQSLLDADPPALVMEYIAGGDLRRFRQQNDFRPLSFEESLPIVRDILEALAFAHSQNIVHRDLSPENVLFDPRDGHWKLADFGLGGVRVESELSLMRSGKSSQLSEGVAGKMPYMAPEQQRADGKVGPEADIYALGVLWSETLAGGESVGLDPNWRDSVPEKAIPLLKSCLSRDPAERRSARECLERLGWLESKRPAEAASTSETASKPPQSEKPKASKPQKEAPVQAATAPQAEAPVGTIPAAVPQKKASLASELGALFQLGLLVLFVCWFFWPQQTQRWLRNAKDKTLQAVETWRHGYAPPTPVPASSFSAFQVYQTPAPFAGLETFQAPLPGQGFGTLDASQSLFSPSYQAGSRAAALIANSSSQRAQELYERANVYYFGQGAPVDYAQARELYLQAAELGHAVAMNNLGVIYDNAQGVQKDNNAAMAWFRKAAEAGDATAMKNVGLMIEGGRGAPQSDAEAVRWYRASADAGDGAGAFLLAERIERGQGISPDFALAERWYQIAADRGYQPAHEALQRLAVPTPMPLGPYQQEFFGEQKAWEPPYGKGKY